MSCIFCNVSSKVQNKEELKKTVPELVALSGQKPPETSDAIETALSIEEAHANANANANADSPQRANHGHLSPLSPPSLTHHIRKSHSKKSNMTFNSARQVPHLRLPHDSFTILDKNVNSFPGTHDNDTLRSKSNRYVAFVFVFLGVN